jgi:predicted Ser/Thr protein kinase
MKQAAGLFQDLKARIYESIGLAPKIVRKPKLFFYWLFSARWAQLVLLLMALSLPKFIPSIVDPQLEKLYPPVTEKKYFGIVKYAKPNPLFESRRKIVGIMLWTGACGLVIFLMVLHIPRALSKTTAMAQKRESEADALADIQPSSSVMLYNSALSLASDPSYEDCIIQKINRIDQRIAEKIEPNEIEENKLPPGRIAMAATKSIEAPPLDSSHIENSAVLAPAADLESNCIGPDGRYLIEKELGRGAMGIVYGARDRILGRNVALKKLSGNLRENKELIRRLKQEAKALARLSHPNIVQVYDFVQDFDQAWIAMELIEGQNIADHLQDRGMMRPGEAVQLAIQIAEALAYAHQRGVIHRDLKPANVILSMDGAAKITDFGLAKIARSSVHTRAGSFLGSPAYMSPEQTRGQAADAYSDIYALGVSLYEMLSGRLPFEGDFESVIAQKLAATPAPLSTSNGEIPGELKELVFQMLAREPDKRPESMGRVAFILKSVSGQLAAGSENRS